MPIKQRSFREVKDNQRFYGFVDSIIEPLPNSMLSRISILFDAIDANVFDNATTSLPAASAFFLLRVMSTGERLSKLFNIEIPAEGRWFEITIAENRGMPRIWRLPLETGYIPGRAMNLVGMQVLDENRAARITKSCQAPQAHRRSAKNLNRILSPLKGEHLEITVLDVGHANCVMFSNLGKPFGFFDVGAPVHHNHKSFPPKFNQVIPRSGFVILSHWDFDHFSLAIKKPALKELIWLAPKQRVGPNAAKFQRSLGDKLFFLTSNFASPTVKLSRCTASRVEDRNNSGYAMRINRADARILLPGDADYQWIPEKLSLRLNRLVMPHHGAAGSTPIKPGSPDPHLVVSYGRPNTYRHPNELQISAHAKSGWQILRTAKHKSQKRGDRTLYPIK